MKEFRHKPGVEKLAKQNSDRKHKRCAKFIRPLMEKYRSRFPDDILKQLSDIGYNQNNRNKKRRKVFGNYQFFIWNAVGMDHAPML